MSRQIVITGMGRSGTSLVANLIQRAGINIGDRLLGAGRGNLRGHFEDTDFFTFHEKMLYRRGQSVFVQSLEFLNGFEQDEISQARSMIKQREDRALWGWKDPRTSLFLDFWQELLPDPRYLFLYRHPLEVTLSLLRRATDMDVLTDPWIAIRAWQAYNENILRFWQAHKGISLLCHISGVTHNVPDWIHQVSKKLDLPLDGSGLQEVYHADELNQGLVNSSVNEILVTIAQRPLELYQELQDKADFPAEDSAVLSECQQRQISDVKDALANFTRIRPVTLRLRNGEQWEREIRNYTLYSTLQSLDPAAIRTAYQELPSIWHVVAETSEEDGQMERLSARLAEQQRIIDDLSTRLINQERDKTALAEQVIVLSDEREQALQSLTAQVNRLSLELQAVHNSRLGKLASFYRSMRAAVKPRSDNAIV